MAVVAGNAAISVVDVLPRQRVHVGDSEMSYARLRRAKASVAGSWLPTSRAVVVEK